MAQWLCWFLGIHDCLLQQHWRAIIMKWHGKTGKKNLRGRVSRSSGSLRWGFLKTKMKMKSDRIQATSSCREVFRFKKKIPCTSFIYYMLYIKLQFWRLQPRVLCRWVVSCQWASALVLKPTERIRQRVLLIRYNNKNVIPHLTNTL